MISILTNRGWHKINENGLCVLYKVLLIFTSCDLCLSSWITYVYSDIVIWKGAKLLFMLFFTLNGRYFNFLPTVI